jgi:hypothetical protein
VSVTTATHPHPTLIEPRNWCTACHHHVANGTLCPVCLDDKAHGQPVIVGTPGPLDGKGTK